MTEREEYVGYYASDPFMTDITRTPMKVPILTTEPIVRCRDCKHSDKTYWTCAHFRAYEGLSDECDLDIEPDGYCAWGERKDG